jgi:hypothetical protein
VDSLDVIKVCLRRWYVFFPLILLAAGAGVGLGKQVKPPYTATGSYSFIYPTPEAITATSDPRNRNPLVTQGNTALLGESVLANLTSELVEDALGGNNRGYAPDETPTQTHYTVTLPPQSASYVVKTWADSQQEAADVVKAVLKAAPKAATDVQTNAGAPVASHFTAFLTAPTQTEELPPQSPAKLLLTVLAIGAVAGAALSLLVDRLFPKRSKGRPNPRRRPATMARPRPGGTGGASGASDAASPAAGTAPRDANPKDAPAAAPVDPAEDDKPETARLPRESVTS